MAPSVAFLLALMTTPLSVHYQWLPAYTYVAYITNDDFFRFVELWRLDTEVKQFAAERQKRQVEMAEFWRKQAVFDLEQAELRGKAERAKNPGG